MAKIYAKYIEEILKTKFGVYMRAIHQVMSTTDYSIFNKIDSNRDLTTPQAMNHLKRLTASIREKNMLPYKPIYVNGDMEVLDGQFRLEVARKLKLPIYYQLNEQGESKDMLLLSANVKGWDTKDYLNHHVKEENSHYIRFNEFISKHKISVRSGLLLLASSVDCCSYEKFKTGRFLFPTMKQMEAVEKMMAVYHDIIEMIKVSRPSGKSFLFTSRFQTALIEFMNIYSKDIKTVQKKFEKYVFDIIPCYSYEIYMNLFKHIYGRD